MKTASMNNFFSTKFLDFPPTIQFNLCLGFFLMSIFIVFICVFDNFLDKALVYGDNSDFEAIANAIKHWDFTHVSDYSRRIFFGFPLVVALFKYIPFLSQPVYAILFVSIFCFFISIYLTHKIWNGWVSAFFIIANFPWMWRCWLGGDEPLFMVFLLGGFYFAQQKKFFIAALIFSFSTTVRPVGFLALMSLALFLFLDKRYRTLIWSICIGVLIGIFYLFMLKLAYNDYLANINTYTDASIGYHLGIPIEGFVESFLSSTLSLITNIKIMLWLMFTGLSLIIILIPKNFKYHHYDKSISIYYTLMHTFFLLTYTSKTWSWLEYPRFIIPMLPMLISVVDKQGLLSFLEDRRIVAFLGVLSTLLAAALIVGFHNL